MYRLPFAASVLTLFLVSALSALSAQGSQSSPSTEIGSQGPAGKAQAIKRDTKGVPLDTDVQKTKSGLEYSVLKEAKAGGRKAGTGDLVRVHYSGWLLDGTQFDTSKKRGEPLLFPLGMGRVIMGWDEGVQLMSEGAIYKFKVPYEMAYGEAGRPPVIPAKAPLIFEVELLEVLVKPKMQPLDPKLTKTTESGLKYQILDPGKGDRVVEGEWVIFKINFFSLKGTLLDWSEKTLLQPGGRYPAGPIGKLGLPFLNEAMKLLAPGGKIRCRVPMAIAFGSNPPPSLPVGKGEDTMWEIEVVERRKTLPDPEFKMSAKDALKKTSTGLEYEVLRSGKEGAKAIKSGSKVKVHYAGWLTSGKLFDSSYSRGMPFNVTVDVDRVIAGWHEGLKLMKEGAVYRFTIPAALAYGPQGSPPVIPENSTLVFQIEVLSVQ